MRVSGYVLKQLRKVMDVVADIYQATGHEPTLAEIAKEVGARPESLAKAQAATADMVDVNDGEYGQYVADTLADRVSESVEDRVFRILGKDLLRVYVEGLLQALPPSDRYMVEMYHGVGRQRGKALTVPEIATRCGISRCRIYQILREARATLFDEICDAAQQYEESTKLSVGGHCG